MLRTTLDTEANQPSISLGITMVSVRAVVTLKGYQLRQVPDTVPNSKCELSSFLPACLVTQSCPTPCSIPGTSWAPSSYPFRSPTSYSSYHCDEHSAQISTSLVWVPPGGTSPRTWPRPPTSCPELSFLRDVGSHEDPRGTHICATNRGGSIRPSGQWDMEATR